MPLVVVVFPGVTIPTADDLPRCLPGWRRFLSSPARRPLTNGGVLQWPVFWNASIVRGFPEMFWRRRVSRMNVPVAELRLRYLVIARARGELDPDGLLQVLNFLRVADGFSVS